MKWRRVWRVCEWLAAIRQRVEKHMWSCAPANTRANTVAILHDLLISHLVCWLCRQLVACKRAPGKTRRPPRLECRVYKINDEGYVINKNKSFQYKP